MFEISKGLIFRENKLVGAICHGGQTLISAGVIEGRKATCYVGIRDDMKSAGVLFVGNL